MKCKLCGTEIKHILILDNNKTAIDSYFRPTDDLLCAHECGVPFFCTFCGAIKFSYKATQDVVFLWPIPLPVKFIKEGVIVRPQSSINDEDEVYGRSNLGVILSVGPGYCDSKKFHPTHSLYCGMKVVYNKDVPWRIYAKNTYKSISLVVCCGFKDVWCIVDD